MWKNDGFDAISAKQSEIENSISEIERHVEQEFDNGAVVHFDYIVDQFDSDYEKTSDRLKHYIEYLREKESVDGGDEIVLRLRKLKSDVQWLDKKLNSD